MNIDELQRRLQDLLAEVKPLAVKSRDADLTDDEDTRFNELVESINDVRKDIATVEARMSRADQVLGTVDELSQSRGRLSSILPRGEGQRPAEPESPEPQFRGIGHRFTESEAFKSYRQFPKGNSQGVEIGSTYHGEYRTVDVAQEMGGPEQRALVHGAAFAGYIQPTRLPGIASGDPFPLSVRDVLQNGRTDSPAVEFVAKNATTNNAAGVAEATTVAGATAKPESAISLEVKSTTVKTIAHFIPVTRQMLQDAAQIETFIEAELLYGLEKAVDTQLVNGAGGANLTGILNTTGVQVLDATPTTGYWATNPLPAGANELDRLRRAVRLGRTVAEASPSFVLANPADVEIWDTLKDGDGNYLLRDGGPDAGGTRRVWGLVIVETLAMTAGRALVGDGRRAIVLDKMDGQIFISDSHSDWFTKNLLAILAEARLALAVTLPAAFLDVTLR